MEVLGQTQHQVPMVSTQSRASGVSSDGRSQSNVEGAVMNGLFASQGAPGSAWAWSAGFAAYLFSGSTRWFVADAVSLVCWLGLRQYVAVAHTIGWHGAALLGTL